MNKSEKIIRHEMFKNNRAIRDYLITDRETQYIDFIVLCEGCFAQQLSEAYSITIHNASTTLRTLYDKKWLSRTCMRDKTGGILYFYRAIKY